MLSLARVCTERAACSIRAVVQVAPMSAGPTAATAAAVAAAARPPAPIHPRHAVVHEVSDHESGGRTIRILAALAPHVSRTALFRLLREGDVRVVLPRPAPGAPAEGSHGCANKRRAHSLRLPTGSLVTAAPAATRMLAVERQAGRDGERWRMQTKVNLPHDAELGVNELIQFATPEVLVVDKPVGMAAQGGSPADMHSSVDALLTHAAERGELPGPDRLAFVRPRLVHRLDRCTSGLMVLARTRSVAADLAHSFAGQTVSKGYLGVVTGVLEPGSTHTINLALRTDGHRVSPCGTDAAGAKAAVTYAEAIAELGNGSTLVAFFPSTGRKHQIRAHAAYGLDMPLVGDMVYDARTGQRPHVPRLMLHASAIALPSINLAITSRPPDSFAAALGLPTSTLDAAVRKVEARVRDSVDLAQSPTSLPSTTSTMDATEVCAEMRALPKVELHRHLEGSLRLESLAALLPVERDEAAAATLAASGGDRMTAARAYYCITTPVTSLTECMDRFGRLQAVFTDAEVIARLTAEVVIDSARDGIALLELRYSPGYIGMACGLDYAAVHDAVRKGVADGRNHPDAAGLVGLGLIGIIDRFQTPAEALTIAKFFVDAGDFIGVDLANDEAAFCDSVFPEAFAHAAAHGLKVTVHAGEVDSPLSAGWVVRAVKEQGAVRIGHGIHVMDADDAVAVVRSAGTVFEISPSSNYLINAVASLESHPVRAMLDAGLPICLNTDDPGLFDITLSGELVTAIHKCGLTRAEVIQANITALDASFLPMSPELAAVRAELETRLAAAL
ncbi:pseudouridine synthase [Thecamonas trahens ATCC 50062]|uniref:adenosine deaminase n=1 Tax=Thecamonas trahens ATCC 50062 TaxID=461836 RepID=A0A0L0DIY9_THETB|nr:pseudouridine synthase [Thecamonas trahens ATCC 50062]KNC52155.1 pseudouridine synthase [Thecamonas trahens ATCC 50062]|eukprot:XP_013762158.1 pseudouridine synthase [Thecamonas trahens ATCC 50062]